MWTGDPPPGARLVCISDFAEATYSGMLPGVLAGDYEPERMRIDLVRWAARAKAPLILDPVTSLDPHAKQLYFESRPPLEFDVLSIGIGSRPELPNHVADDAAFLAIKPMQTLRQRLFDRLGEAKSIAVVGAGAGGCEVALCLPAALRSFDASRDWSVTLVDGGERIGHGLSDRTRDALKRDCEQRGVTIRTGFRVTRVEVGRIVSETGEELAADVVIWAGRATAPKLLSRFDLPQTEAGFLRTDATLAVEGQPGIFAVGDSGTITEYDLPKAGVYAVRSAPVLWANIGRHLAGDALQRYEPQRRFLKLLNRGDGTARADWFGRTIAGRWVHHWKDHIDGKFMDMYQSFEPMKPAKRKRPPSTTPEMRCHGCGGKAASGLLREVLAELTPDSDPERFTGDVATLPPSGERQVIASVDLFAAPFDDAFLTGQVAALNALSDLFASGAEPHSALAVVTLPEASHGIQRQTLRDVLGGAVRIFDRFGVTLAGGHTLIGHRLDVGFTILGHASERMREKTTVQESDALILTKPLGSGVLLRQLMQGDLSAQGFLTLRESLLLPNRLPDEIVTRVPIHAATDITGFGLASHLSEMLRPSGWSATLDLHSLPLLPGTEEALSAGVRSTLHDANRAGSLPVITSGNKAATNLRTEALFDPQTHGGLLLSVPADVSEELVAALRGAGHTSATAIGVVTRKSASSIVVE